MWTFAIRFNAPFTLTCDRHARMSSAHDSVLLHVYNAVKVRPGNRFPDGKLLEVLHG